MYTFQIKLTSDHKIDTTSADNLLTCKLDVHINLGVDSRITGISNRLVDSENGIDIIVFSPSNKKLWYTRVEFGIWYANVFLLNDNIDYIRESFFAGTNTGIVNYWTSDNYF